MKRRLVTFCTAVLLGVGSLAGAAPRRRHIRVPGVDLKQRVIWGATCESPDGAALAFGGQDQQAPDGRPHTRIKIDGQWKAIHKQLREKNPWQALCVRAWALRERIKDTAAAARRRYFGGPAKQPDHPEVGPLLKEIESQLADMSIQSPGVNVEMLPAAETHLKAALHLGKPLGARPALASREGIRTLEGMQIAVAKAAELLDAEPPARALSPIVHDRKSGLFVLFGGDHCDYLTSDLWVFDPKRRRWSRRLPKAAPAPRAMHTLTAAGDGRIVLSGGYTYTSNTDYCGGQYAPLDDGTFTYDLAADRWTGGTLDAPDARTYRSGPFHPDHFLQGPPPDRKKVADELAALPTNVWISRKPPYRPRQNRDWGGAKLDTDRDMILRWSGGHSAHGGTDVPHYHVATNRWELPVPVEFPLGQLYSNTSYPHGLNLNRRPWMTGHTYRTNAYDPVSRRLIFAVWTTYVYNPDRGDWEHAMWPSPSTGGFYNTNLCTTPAGVVMYSTMARRRYGIARWEDAVKQWKKLPVKWQAKPVPVSPDRVGNVYDSKRDRMLVFDGASRGYSVGGSGDVFAYDFKTGVFAALAPKGKDAAAKSTAFLRELVYVPEADGVLFAAKIRGGQADRFLFYDCAANAWKQVKLGGKVARGVSTGLVYDPKRKLLWVVDTNGNVFACRFVLAESDAQPLHLP